MPLTPGEPAPWFTAPTASNPEFVFDTAAGRYVLLAFLPLDETARGTAMRALAAHQPMFDDERLACFAVVRDPATAAAVRDLRGLRWVIDLDGAISRRYDALGADGAERPFWMVLDPTLRVMAMTPLDKAEALFAYLSRLPAPADHAGVPNHAPVLIAPRVFEPELCAELVALHEGGTSRFTGVMRDEGDRTVAVMDELKKRRDVLVTAPDLQAAIRERLERRLFPQIHLALGFQATEIERYVVSCYDSADGAVFHAHRDNTTLGTAHRRFACSINLNDGFEGGDLRFAEFGRQTYRPPLGGAVVFSCALMHEATRVTAGRRYAFLPFLYDQGGAEILAEYERRTADPAPAAAPVI